MPQDPINTTTTGNYYTYATNGSQFIVTAIPEAQKTKSNLATNPQIPNYPEVMAQGSNLTISPLWSPTGLVGYWNFEEGSGTTAIDTSGNQNNGSWAGTAPYYASGKVGSYAGNFDGSTDYVNLGNPSSLNGFTSFTIGEWVNANQSLATVAGVGRRVGSAGLSLGFGSWGSVCATGKVDVVEGASTGLCGNTILSLSTWYDVVAVMSGSNVTIYINGQQDANGTDNWTWTTGNNIYIGATGGAHIFPGLIDDVRIYDRALSASEIQALYNAEK